MTARIVSGLGLVVVAVIALTGCTAAAESATSATPSHTRSATPTPTPSAPCLVGSWTADAASLQPAYDAIPSGLDYPAATIDPAATATIAFAPDGTFDFTQDVPASVSWMQHTAAVALGGEMAGTYTASGTALALMATDNRLTVQPTDDANASALFAAATQETLSEWPVSATSFTCSGDELVLDLDTEGHDAEVTFHRA